MILHQKTCVTYKCVLSLTPLFYLSFMFYKIVILYLSSTRNYTPLSLALLINPTDNE